MNHLRQRALLCVMALFSCAGCQTVEMPRYYQERLSASFFQEHWLPQLQDGVTTRGQVEASLGAPSCRYENGRLTAYRLILNSKIPQLFRGIPSAHESNVQFKYIVDRQLELVEKSSLLVVRDENHEQVFRKIITAAAEYSLVLVYDGSGVLERHFIQRRHP